MKKIFLNNILVLCVLIFFTYACKKKNQEPAQPEYQFGNITGLKVNDTLFSKKGMTLTVLARKSNIQHCLFSNIYSLTIEQKSNTNNFREKFTFGDLSTDRKGVFQISSSNQSVCDSTVSLLGSIADGDHVLNFYNPMRGQKNTITLAEYNKSTKEISGTFDVTLLIDFGTPYSRVTYPDTIRLYNCQFKTVLND